MRILSALVLALLLALPLALGCNQEPAIPAGELGEIIYEVPRVPGTEAPYQLPEAKAKAPPEAERMMGP